MNLFRASEKHETEGLDWHMHGEPAYPIGIGLKKIKKTLKFFYVFLEAYIEESFSAPNLDNLSQSILFPKVYIKGI